VKWYWFCRVFKGFLGAEFQVVDHVWIFREEKEAKCGCT
jgi:hypothetical protein